VDGTRRELTGLGHDLQLVSELEAAQALREPGIFFTPGELRRFDSAAVPLESMAACFAAKEALFKALPPPQQGGCTWFWTDAELTHDSSGAPRFRTHQSLADYLDRRGLRVCVSISHSGGFASSVVIVTREDPVVEGNGVYLEESRLTIPVRPNDLDALGHVNNAVVVEYLEAGRWDWLGRQGLTHGDGIIAVVARTEVDYLAEISRGEVEVRTRLESPTARELDDDTLTFRARFRQRVYRPGMDTPAVDALVTVAFLDAAQRCLVSLQDFLTASVPD
jgi:acyl-CoA thioester hydrolase